MRARVRVCAGVRACARARVCARVCVCARACVRVRALALDAAGAGGEEAAGQGRVKHGGRGGDADAK